MLKILNKIIINNIGRDTTEYISSNTMNMIAKKINPFIWTYDLKALILDIKKENKDVITITLLPNQHWKDAKAGQYIELKLLIEGKECRRYYSISSVKDKLIKITIKKIKNGIVSNWIHQNFKVGMSIDISGAFGDFTYKNQDKLLFISAGSGITPCFSILNDLLYNNKCVDIQFFTQFSKLEDVIFSNELNNLSKKMNLTIALTQENNSKKITQESFKNLFPDFQERNIYLCGPEGFMNSVINILEKEKYNLENLFIEKFVEKKYKNTNSEILPIVYFKQYNKKIQTKEDDKNKSILELGLENGLNLERGCKKGICGTCKLILHEGSVEGNKLGKAIYICTAFPSSELVVLGT
jgi:ferredoxin-NADP reductase